MPILTFAARAASAPAPNGTPYVAGAYIFFLLVVVAYVGIMALRLTRNQREIQRLSADLDARDSDTASSPVDSDQQERVA